MSGPMQSICWLCWHERNPDTYLPLINAPGRNLKMCCVCRESTGQGIQIGEEATKNNEKEEKEEKEEKDMAASEAFFKIDTREIHELVLKEIRKLQKQVESGCNSKARFRVMIDPAACDSPVMTRGDGSRFIQLNFNSADGDVVRIPDGNSVSVVLDEVRAEKIVNMLQDALLKIRSSR